MLLIYGDPADTPADDSPEGQAEFGQWMQFHEQITASGVQLGAAPLQDAGTATTVRVRDDERVLSDGPFAETKEMLGRLLRGRRPRPRHCDRLGAAHAARRPRIGRGAPGDGAADRVSVAAAALETAYRGERAGVLATLTRHLGDLGLPSPARR